MSDAVGWIFRCNVNPAIRPAQAGLAGRMALQSSIHSPAVIRSSLTLTPPRVADGQRDGNGGADGQDEQRQGYAPGAGGYSSDGAGSCGACGAGCGR